MNAKLWLTVVGAIGAVMLVGDLEFAVAANGVIVQDTFIQDLGENGADTNSGGDTLFRVGNDPGWRYDALVQFDLPPNPDGKAVQSATLSLFNNEYEWANRGDGDFGVVATTSSWDESTVTWNTAPSFNETPVYDIVQFAGLDPPDPDGGPVHTEPNEWKSWDVTALVQSWYDGSIDNNGMRMIGMNNLGTGDGGANTFPAFRSKEFEDPALWPMLSVNLVPEPSSVTLLFMALAGMVGWMHRKRR